MRLTELNEFATQLFSNHKGILAIDESIATCNKRFQALGIPQTEEFRRTYRELIITTPSLSDSIAGVILCDETFRQQSSSGRSFLDLLKEADIAAGIKVDLGAKVIPGQLVERLTSGLDLLASRLDDYRNMGARFAKWRAVFTIGSNLPSDRCIEQNAKALAVYAYQCQQAGLVPIVEPEVLMSGDHSLELCADVNERVLLMVFDQLFEHDVAPEGLILKTNMVLSGQDCLDQPSTDEVAMATFDCLKAVVPFSVPAVAFLSGGQTGQQASERLNSLNLHHHLGAPWALGFSFGRAIQQPAIDIWMGEAENWEAAQKALLHRAQCNVAARGGHYSSKMEKEELPPTTRFRSHAIQGFSAQYAAAEKAALDEENRDMRALGILLLKCLPAPKKPLYPMKFAPIFQYRPWGGRRLAELLEVKIPDGLVGEAWVLSDREEQASLVTDGPLQGKSINELLHYYREELMGDVAHHYDRFPLLLKFLDVSDRLSVQVHPADTQAAYIPAGEMGKTEAWVVLEANAGSKIYAGLRDGTEKSALRKAITDDQVAEFLSELCPKTGDCVFVEARTVHSLEDVVVFEIQENSDVTYRLYDWNRVDPKTGKHRELEVESALACVDFNRKPVKFSVPQVIDRSPVVREKLFDCSHFEVNRITGSNEFLLGSHKAPTVLVSLDGSGEIHTDNDRARLAKGEVMLLPAALGACAFQPSGNVNLLAVSVAGRA